MDFTHVRPPALPTLLACLGLIAGMPMQAQGEPAQPFAVPQSGVTLITGDTWQQNGLQMRLYGVQSCIRGTQYTNPAGARLDCGEASAVMLGALIKDTRPACTPIAQINGTAESEPATILVVCTAHVGANNLDLGTIMITQGYAFAAFTLAGKPVYTPYIVAEAAAKNAKVGLWAAQDLQDPNAILFNAVNASK
ncbi:succinoglycan biosynthesis protein exoi [Labrys miyagiensis]|uniref:Succinoglycan biosynthesis protein exoi n=1 Tax=Labrys miyagiensis TaxID=346912 RepID=A0ABQ6CDP4_9HYPH|nr:thermonuclease family protein [Labrys miyagiensis]GLS18045.1 succinoglycan biosynthesis protein exoi [Labrys miyagiensis]